MALLSNGEDGNHWQIVNIGQDVLVIENPGGDFEHVHLRLSTNREDVVKNIARIKASDFMSSDQKLQAGFWYGYFYAHLVQR